MEQISASFLLDIPRAQALILAKYGKVRGAAPALSRLAKKAGHPDSSSTRTFNDALNGRYVRFETLVAFAAALQVDLWEIVDCPNRDTYDILQAMMAEHEQMQASMVIPFEVALGVLGELAQHFKRFLAYVHVFGYPAVDELHRIDGDFGHREDPKTKQAREDKCYGVYRAHFTTPKFSGIVAYHVGQPTQYAWIDYGRLHYDARRGTHHSSEHWLNFNRSRTYVYPEEEREADGDAAAPRPRYIDFITWLNWLPNRFSIRTNDPSASIEFIEYLDWRVAESRWLQPDDPLVGFPRSFHKHP